MPNTSYPIAEGRLRYLRQQRDYWRNILDQGATAGLIYYKDRVWYEQRVLKQVGDLHAEIDELALLLATATVQGDGNGG